DEREQFALTKANELEMFAGRVAHDLKNPLSAIAMPVSLGRRRFASNELGAEFERLAANVQRMNEIIEDLLAFARAGGTAGATTPTNLKSVIDGVIADFIPEATQE